MNAKLWTIVGGVALACVIFSELPANAAGYRIPYRNRMVLRHAQALLGQPVGDGQCTALVVAVLAETGSKPGNFSNPTFYDWGTYVRPYRAKYRGDIIQFEGVVLKGSTGNGGTYESNFPHHTAIVKSVLGNNRYVILEQNSNGRQFVTEQTIDLNDKKSGSVVFFRPEAQ